ncbi:MAG: pyridoxamine 5'-phosphate oxidase family protein [Phycisphaeraceae bacterium]
MGEPDFDLVQEVSVFLASCRTASLATVGVDGAAHAANVQYTGDGAFGLLWVSSPAADHSQDLEHDQRAAVTVYAHDDRPASIHGVQMRGVVERVEDEGAWNTAWEAYTAKFPFVAVDPEFKVMVEKQAFYRFTPSWLRWIDNRRGFGWKVERELV